MSETTDQAVYQSALATLGEMQNHLAYVIETNEHFLLSWRDAGLIEHTAIGETELAMQRLQLAAIRYAIAHIRP